MKKLKFVFVGLLLSLSFFSAQAQVKDVCFTASPLIEYNWWNNNINLKNGPFYGARLGFGFGPFFELRATAEKSLNLKGQVEGKEIQGVNIDILRVGAEAKINITGGTTFSPYITAGTGVQFFDYNPFDTKTLEGLKDDIKNKEQQIFVSLGAGVKVKLSDRMVLSLEAKNIRFNMDSGNPYFKANQNEKDNKVGTWAGLASMDFYLGGNSRALADKYGSSYHNLFTDGFVGPKFVIEPGFTWANFNNKIHPNNQWFVGGSAGVDFSSLIGLRAFYYQATKEPNKLGFDFNKDLKMYGANIITRLNYPRGIVPYLQLGVGYLDRNNFIENPDEQPINQSNLFAVAGAGVEVPLSRYIAFYGTVNSMLMSNKEKVKDITNPSQIVNNMMYTMGLRFNLGMPASAPSMDENMSEDKEGVMSNERINNMRGKCSKMMTKKEFEDMVNRIVKKIQLEEANSADALSDNDMAVILAALNQKKLNNTANLTQDNQELINEIRNLIVTLNKKESAAPAQAQPAVTVVNPTPAVQPAVVPANTVVAGNNTPAAAVTRTSNNGGSAVDFLKLNRVALFAGPSFGESFTLNLGVRGYMQVSNTNLDFMPELFFGIGSKNSYGMSANIVYNIDMKSDMVSPYVGLGLGLFNHGNGSRMGTNFIVGANINNIANGQLFVDYSARTGFKNNQIAVGYRFVF